MSRETDEVLDHDYDGIQEYNNPLPGWWLWTFYLSIAFALVYVPYYHFMDGPDQDAEYAAEMAAATASLPEKKESTGSELAAVVKDPARVAEGKEVFTKFCVACHKADAGGLVGPNLTDNQWKNGGKLADQVKVVTQGIKGTAMVAWNKQLTPKQIESVVAYIRTLRGTNPPGAKAPEGEVYEGDE